MKALTFCAMVAVFAALLPSASQAQTHPATPAAHPTSTRSDGNVPVVVPPVISPQDQDKNATGDDRVSEKEQMEQDQQAKKDKEAWENDHPVQSFFESVGSAISRAMSKLSSSSPENSTSSGGGARGGVRGGVRG